MEDNKELQSLYALDQVLRTLSTFHLVKSGDSSNNEFVSKVTDLQKDIVDKMSLIVNTIK